MPLCPSCQTTQERRREGRCPRCGVAVEVYKGQWYRAEIGSPTIAVLKHFEKRVSDYLSHGRPVRVPYSIPRKGLRFQRELVSSERLLDIANGDFDLVTSALDILFDDKKFNWKLRNSLMYIDRDFLAALAIARANRAMAEAKKRQEDNALLDVLRREDIF